ncbi:acyl-CoA dehydrogenase family protein [Actinophytocola sp.]|uniref:acyl-CoA dehydrogenase family protein n=1 Tax=Actinophytocola sp. TaxID=1872138 RepID=UPI00389A95A5
MTVHTGPHANRLAELSTLAETFAERADGYDRTATFPVADFDDLFAAGLHAPTVPVTHGGLGLGPLRGDALGLWLMTKRLAAADLSLARCWEGHTNSMVLIDALGSEAQKSRWFDGVVRLGERWVAWSGEPRAPKPGEAKAFGTNVRREGDGWIIDGTKVFATSATGADWAILLVDTAGPGGARNSTSDAGAGVLMLACELADPSVSVDASWWDPIGMRATVSHLVRFDHTYIPDSQRIGEAGDYLRQGWQTAFIPHYAASFLGAAEAAYGYALEYVTRQRKHTDPYVQQRVGAMAVAVETGGLWLKHVAELWDSGRRAEASMAGSRARHLVEHLALDTVDHCVRACGARCLVRPSPVERIQRDLLFYVRHDNDDHILATIGRNALGEAHDPSFYKP